MGRLRGKLTYSNVMVTLLAFVMLSGGAAYAASQLGKKTVGAKQLKPNAVTTAKVKKNAVTRAKIKVGSIDGSKIADGSVTGTDINVPSTPFSRIVYEARGSSTVDLKNATFVVYPLTNPTYTQSPGSDDVVRGCLMSPSSRPANFRGTSRSRSSSMSPTPSPNSLPIPTSWWRAGLSPT